MSCFAWGLMTHYCLEAAAQLQTEGVSVEVVDLRTLAPLDRGTILESVRKTGKAIVVHEDNLTGGFGADVVIEAVGRPETWKQAFYARDLAGTVVLVGVPTPDMRLEMPMIDFFSRGGSLKSSWYGDCLPSRDFPYLVDLYQQGKLDLDAFVTERIALDQVEEAFTKMHHGDVLRSVVIF